MSKANEPKASRCEVQRNDLTLDPEAVKDLEPSDHREGGIRGGGGGVPSGI